MICFCWTLFEQLTFSHIAGTSHLRRLQLVYHADRGPVLWTVYQSSQERWGLQDGSVAGMGSGHPVSTQRGSPSHVPCYPHQQVSTLKQLCTLNMPLCSNTSQSWCINSNTLQAGCGQECGAASERPDWREHHGEGVETDSRESLWGVSPEERPLHDTTHDSSGPQRDRVSIRTHLHTSTSSEGAALCTSPTACLPAGRG